MDPGTRHTATSQFALYPTIDDSAQDLAAELVHYGFLHEVGRGHSSRGKGLGSGYVILLHTIMLPSSLQDDRTKLAAFLETTFIKYRGTQS